MMRGLETRRGHGTGFQQEAKITRLVEGAHEMLRMPGKCFWYFLELLMILRR